MLRLEQPVTVQDYVGATVLLHWIVWTPVTLKVTKEGAADRLEPATALYMLNDRTLDYEDFKRQLSLSTKPLPPDFDEIADRMLGRWFPVGVHLIPDGAPLGPNRVLPTEEEQAESVSSADR